MIKQRFTLRDIENITGIEANTLRVWKNRYGILSQGTVDSGKLQYSPGDLRYIIQIKTLLDSGMKISDITSLTRKELTERIWAKTLNHSILPTSRLENLLLEAILELDITKLESAYNQILESHSFPEAMEAILLPFLNKCGELWTYETIHVAQEHFISNFIRHKLIASADLLPKTVHDPEYLLFLPEHEIHEIPLLFINYLILKRGFRTLYLGESIPYINLDDVLNQKSSDRVVTGWLYGGESANHIESMALRIKDYSSTIFYLNCPEPDKHEVLDRLQGDTSNIIFFQTPGEFRELLS